MSKVIDDAKVLMDNAIALHAGLQPIVSGHNPSKTWNTAQENKVIEAIHIATENVESALQDAETMSVTEVDRPGPRD